MNITWPFTSSMARRILGKKTKILLLAANPQKTFVLELGKEFRTIKEGLQLGKYRGDFEIVQGEAVRAKDFLRLVLSEKPDIIHFSGHATTEGIGLEDEHGAMQLVSGAVLAELLGQGENLQCVILNACYSDAQAQALTKVVPFVIGMKSTLRDEAAIRFSAGFYYALAEEVGIEKAFHYGVISINMENNKNYYPSRSLDMDRMEVEELADKPILLVNRNGESYGRVNSIPLSFKISLSVFIVICSSYLLMFYFFRVEDDHVGSEVPEAIQIEGKVLEYATSNPLPVSHAEIYFPELNLKMESRVNGEFSRRYYPNITKHKKQDLVVVKVSHQGYETYEESYSIGEFMRIYLNPVRKK